MSKAAIHDRPAGRDEEAAEWCMRLAEGRLDLGEQTALDRWLDVRDNRAAFDEAIAVWQGIEILADKPEFIRIRTQGLESLRDANSRRWARHLPLGWRHFSGIAAAIALGVATVLFVVHDRAAIYETATGERRLTQLDDGSRISLDAATRVEVRLADDRRELRLVAGRAKFDVAKDPLRPFSVAVGDKVIVATGTSFSVERLREEMRVILYEGHIEVLQQLEATKPRPLDRPPDSPLAPGRELVAALDKSAVTVIPADLPRSLSWQAGQLNFVNEPLESAVERMNRYSKDPFVLGDATIAKFSINGVFAAGDTAAFIEGVTTFFPVEAVHQKGAWVLRRAAAPKNSAQGAVLPES